MDSNLKEDYVKVPRKRRRKAHKLTKPSKRSKKTAVKTLKKRRGILTKRILRHRSQKKFEKQYGTTRGVVYLSHVPHGFYETEMREFFGQFGTVTNINIPRSNRTGKYKGYAFVEFKYPEVAKVVAETMDNYLMFQKVMKAKYIPPEEQKPMCFRLAKFAVPLLLRKRRYLRLQSNRERNEEEIVEENKRLRANLKKKVNKLKKLGIDYEFQVDNVSS